MENKKVLYVTTKNIDYIRNVQMINMIKENYSDYKIIYSKRKNYYLRILETNIKLLFENKKKYDVLFLGFLPQLVFNCLSNKKSKSQIIIIDFIISLHNTLVYDRKKVKPNTFLAKFLKMIDSRITKKADIVITDTNTQAKYFEKEFNIDKSKFKTIYLEANSSIYNKSVPKIKLCNSDEFAVVWFGSVLNLQGIDVILEAAKLLENNKKIIFYIIGNTNRIKVNKSNYNNIHFISWLEDKELAKYVNSADLCLAGHFSKDIERANREISGKAFTYKALEKKMILGDSEANHELFEESNNIFYVERGNPEELAKTIEKIYKQTINNN